MNVLLVLPNVYLGNRIGDHESKEPLGLLYLAAVLRSEDYEVSVLQADYYGLSVEQTVDIVLFHNPAVVGFSLTQRAAPSVLKTVELLRKRGFVGHITSGGYLPSLCTEDFLNRATEIDSVVVGEGEKTFLDLVECLDYGSPWNCVSGLAYHNGTSVVINQPRPLIKDLDTLPFPSRDFLTDAFGRMGYANLISSRGCYGNCTFCPQNAFKCKNPGPRWRGRGPENVVDEMENINRDYNIGMFKFNDDNIFGPGETGRERVIGICEEIIRRGVKVSLMAYCRINDIEHKVMALMRKAGFERLLVGIESTVPAILREYKKRFH
ncbi:B12-binding domain-containing radical SAM protein [Patescibacteria group bacterium]|nr:B12-binding domain-containing radical SAM protein [Patescibacteria group bacterium]MBU4367668.1 B12-binding domain-containing radical SAM protein [Patescibacteria group bacterium]MBU4461882.1 B12-binding domain-containing radical SAM protein [Patescibacteria group bacterium]MCG2699987.1 B12-binding domain-containing radical SAM protein [Candidatus Parcubacteria bacterium]